MCIDSSCPGFNNVNNLPAWRLSAIIQAGWVAWFYPLALGRHQTAQCGLFHFDTHVTRRSPPTAQLKGNADLTAATE